MPSSVITAEKQVDSFKNSFNERYCKCRRSATDMYNVATHPPHTHPQTKTNQTKKVKIYSKKFLLMIVLLKEAFIAL